MAQNLNTASIMLDWESLPKECATSNFVAPPTLTNLNYAGSGRASTPLFGTSPYMAGRGAPANVIMVEDMLRPQSTSYFTKGYAGRSHDFPKNNMECSVPLRTRARDPVSSRANVQNDMFSRRYNF